MKNQLNSPAIDLKGTSPSANVKIKDIFIANKSSSMPTSSNNSKNLRVFNKVVIDLTKGFIEKEGAKVGRIII